MRWDAPAAAVELIHSYSLVHDDLPSMDDDDLRRGRPTTHRAFDEATAILAGDALQVLAFSLLARDRAPGVSPEARLKMIRILAEASGTAGMVGGQALDLSAVGSNLELHDLEPCTAQDGALIRQRIVGGGLRADRLKMGRTDATRRTSASHFKFRTTSSTSRAIPRSGQTIGADGPDKPTYPACSGSNPPNARS
jgi:geranylgeranyl pyrophosphate synthase